MSKQRKRQLLNRHKITADNGKEDTEIEDDKERHK